MRIAAIVAGASIIGTSGLALANPIMVVDEAYAQQVPGTLHVQTMQLSSMGPASTMQVTRDGRVVAGTVESLSAAARDLGSGYSNVYALVRCDCNVPMGAHSYVIGSHAVQLEVVDAATGALTPPEPSGGCAAQCTTAIAVPPAIDGSGSGGAVEPGAGGSGGAQPGGSATGGATSDTGTAGDSFEPDSDEGSSSSCSVSRTERGLHSAMLLGLLGLLGWRRGK